MPALRVGGLLNGGGQGVYGLRDLTGGDDCRGRDKDVVSADTIHTALHGIQKKPALKRGLRNLRKHHRRIEHFGRLVVERESLQRRVRDDHRVVSVLDALAQPRLDVAAQRSEREIGTSSCELGLPSRPLRESLPNSSRLLRSGRGYLMMTRSNPRPVRLSHVPVATRLTTETLPALRD